MKVYEKTSSIFCGLTLFVEGCVFYIDETLTAKVVGVDEKERVVFKTIEEIHDDI